jgi:GTP cyclohydrolase II
VTRVIARVAEKNLATRFGTWREILYYDGKAACVALLHGEVTAKEVVPCRIQSHCLSAFVFNSVECDCREQMTMAQSFIQIHGYGIIIWLDQDGRDEGHLACMLASDLSIREKISETEAYQRLGYSPDRRTYLTAASVLRDLGVLSIELLSNNPNKARALEGYGLQVAGMQPVVSNPDQNPWLHKTYSDKMEQGHIIELPAAGDS